MTLRGTLGGLRRVRVGSTNPPKLEGVRAALAHFAPAVSVEGVDVASGVSEQPLGFEEIIAGARNRAAAARRSGDCDLAVGYEDGLVEVPGDDGTWFNVGCAALCDGSRISLGLSPGFRYPPSCTAPAVSQRAPIGEVFDRFWRQHREPRATEASALSVGNVGRLTEGALTRTEYTRQAVLCALAALLHPDLFDVPRTRV